MNDLITLSHQLLEFSRARVLCLGDVMLDRYVYGRANRLSPEAPIPVLKVDRLDRMLGGAGNVTRNVATLGARASLVGVVGDDAAGRTIQEKLDARDRVGASLLTVPSRMTTVKTRYIVGSQQLLRADEETALPLEGDTADSLLRLFAAELEHADVVVLSDYGKGVLSEDVLGPAIQLARTHGVPIVADPKSRDFSRYSGVSVLMPNAAELSAATGLPCSTDDEAIEAAQAARGHGIDNVLVTRSAEGMTLAGADHSAHMPARAREIHDVSGAGDTAAATLSVALAAGFALEDAARLANVAAGVVVEKVGTAAVHSEDLIVALQSDDLLNLGAEVVPLERAVEQVQLWRTRGQRIGFTNGCFDLIHPGHVSLLTQARAACDRLIVGLNTDASIKRLKGPGRPVQRETARSVVLASLAAVDLVVLFDEDTPLELIETLRPDLLVKGADYTREQVVGADMVSSYGGEVLLARLEPGFSTTGTIARAGARSLPGSRPSPGVDRSI